MHKTAFVLACLACAAYGRQAQASNTVLQSSLLTERQKPIRSEERVSVKTIVDPWESFAKLLLGFTSATAFSSGVRHPLGNSIRGHPCKRGCSMGIPSHSALRPVLPKLARSTDFSMQSDDDTPTAKGTALIEKSWYDTLLDDLKMRLRIFQKSREETDDIKRNIADVLAGEYDADAVRENMEELIVSAPVVMFSWKSSPSCKSAIKAFGLAEANFKNIGLDDPWDKGNPLRAELAKKVGRTSVPFIFLNGTYAGGFDGGVSEEAPGILEMAFKGNLLPKLEAIGARDGK